MTAFHNAKSAEMDICIHADGLRFWCGNSYRISIKNYPLVTSLMSRLVCHSWKLSFLIHEYKFNREVPPAINQT